MVYFENTKVKKLYLDTNSFPLNSRMQNNNNKG